MIMPRFAPVELVFGNIRHNKRLDRFMLRGQRMVDGQWKLCRKKSTVPIGDCRRVGVSV